MSGSKSKSKNIKIFLIVFVMLLKPSVSGAQLHSQNINLMNDSLLEKCSNCNDQLQLCVSDLKDSRDMRPSKEWWNNDIFIWGLTIASFGAGFIVGVYSK